MIITWLFFFLSDFDKNKKYMSSFSFVNNRVFFSVFHKTNKNFNDVDKELVMNQQTKCLKAARYYWFGYLAIVREVNLACFGVLIVAANRHEIKLIINF